MDKALEFISRMPSAILAAFLALSVALSVSCKGKEVSSSSSIEQTKSSETSEELISSGNVAPDFTLPDVNGVSHTLSSFRGKTVLLNFWATWCVPCVAEMPALERLYQLKKDKGLEIVAVSVDTAESSEDVIEFLKKNGISFTVLRDTEISKPEAYGVSGFPESFFIGKDGKFISLNDPEAKSHITRIISERAWDSEAMVKAVSELLEKQK